MTSLIQRLLIGIPLMTLVVLLILFSSEPIGHALFGATIAIVSVLATKELYQISEIKGYQPFKSLGLISSIAIIAAAFFTVNPALPILFILLGTALGSFLLFFYQGKRPLENIGITLFSLLYIAIPLSFTLQILNPLWLLYLLVVTKIADIAAYFVGRSCGKNLLASFISPNKTWEGAIAGILASVLTSFLFHYYGLPITLMQSLWLGALIGFFSLIGDLAESLLKRDMGVKDSGTIPGIGGILDAIDSLIFTIPVLYLFLLL